MFNLYFAGGEHVVIPLTEKDNCGKLFTFAEGPKTLDKFVQNETCKIFIDSGAFTLAHAKVPKQIKIDDYIQFINDHPSVTLYATLDEIPFPVLNAETSSKSAKITWENYVYMLNNVNPELRDKIVPVYHYGEPKEYIHKIINGVDGYKPKYMAFGGRAGVSKKPLHVGLTNFFNEVSKSSNPNIKVHGFGITMLDTLELFPFYSADSTTWLRTGINGKIHSKVDNTVVFISDVSQYRPEHFIHKTKQVQELILKEISDNGFTYEDLATNYKSRHLYNCQFFKNWADNFTFKPKISIKRRGLY